MVVIPKYRIGDKVRVIKYGTPILIEKDQKVPEHAVLIEEDGEKSYYDIQPEIVGSEGTIKAIKPTDFGGIYALNGVSKMAPYNEDQLELVRNEEIEEIETDEDN